MKKIHTSALRDGDEVLLYGAVIRIQGKPLVTEGPGGKPHYMWPDMTVVSGELSFAPDARVFTVAGDERRTWRLARRGA